MKNYNIYVILFLSFVLMGCPKSDDLEIIQNFEPITIDLTDLNIQLDDTSFTKDGFQFSTLRVVSNNSGFDDGIVLAQPLNGNPSVLELDLSNLNGLSKVTGSILNNAGGTTISLWNNGVLVQETEDIPNATLQIRFVDTSLDINNQSVDLLRITSFEAIVQSIKLE